MTSFISTVERLNDRLNGIVWGPYMIALLIGVGVLFTIRLKGIQVTKFKYIWSQTVGKAFKPSEGEGNISSG